MKTHDRIAVGSIWLVVVVGAFVLGVNTSDPGGGGQTAAGVGIALTSLYFLVRGLRSRDLLIDVDEDDEDDVGSATASWLKAVFVIVLWVVGSVVAILARVPDAYAVLLGWLLPLGVFLYFRFRRAARRV